MWMVQQLMDSLPAQDSGMRYGYSEDSAGAEGRYTSH